MSALPLIADICQRAHVRMCHKQTFFYSSTDAHRHLTERPEKGLATIDNGPRIRACVAIR